MTPDGHATGRKSVINNVSSGKGQGSIKTVRQLLSGQSFSFEATDVRAFDGVAFQAEVEKIVAQANAETIQTITPELGDVVDAIVDAVVRISTGGAL